MKRPYFHKLNQSGFHHYFVAAAAFVLLFGIAGVYFLLVSHAAAVPEIKSALNGNYCLVDPSANLKAQAPMGVAKCNGNKDQQWTFSNGLLINTALSGTHCVQPKGGVLTAQTPVVMDSCTKSSPKVWTRIGSGSSISYKTSNGLVLTVPNADTDSQLQIRENNSSNEDQNWSEQQHKNSSSSGDTIAGCRSQHSSDQRGTAAAKCYAHVLLADHHWGDNQFSCLDNIYIRESGWRYNAANPSGAYGIPQALPGGKMSSAGSDWRTDPVTQISWGLGYIKGVYGSPCNAWSFWRAHNWYITAIVDGVNIHQ